MIRTYLLLTKPGIIMGNLVTTSAAFLLGSGGHFDMRLFAMTVIGLGFVIASACVWNNCIDRHADAKMERTKDRALAKGMISLWSACLFAILLGIAGAAVLALYTNLWAFLAASIGFFVYVILYSFWKYRTMYATLVGSIAGAMPPVVGYCAAANQLGAGALILFFILVFWQMPHFFSIAMYRCDDYQAASIPVLPGELGMLAAKRQMLVYIALFIVAIAMLSLFGYTGYLCMFGGVLLGAVWFRVAIKGWQVGDESRWARSMFRVSLVVIMGLSLLISADGFLR